MRVDRSFLSPGAFEGRGKVDESVDFRAPAQLSTPGQGYAIQAVTQESKLLVGSRVQYPLQALRGERKVQRGKPVKSRNQKD